jgi:hypothetical protein
MTQDVDSLKKALQDIAAMDPDGACPAHAEWQAVIDAALVPVPPPHPQPGINPGDER